MTDEEMRALFGEDVPNESAADTAAEPETPPQDAPAEPVTESLPTESEQPAEQSADAAPDSAPPADPEQPAEEPKPITPAQEKPFFTDIGDLFSSPRPMPPQRPVPPPIPEQQPPLPFSEEPFAESFEKPVKTKKVSVSAVLLTIFCFLMLAAAVFCIIWDVSRGTTSGGTYRAGDIVEVQLIQHEKPEIDTTLANEDGFYTIEGVAKAVMPSIVQIYTYADGKSVGSGSGIILTKDGYIATNAHVVKDSEQYSVKLFDEANSETPYDAVLIGHDTKTDLAVLKIPAHELTPAQLGNSDQVHLGETVCALGNPAGLSGSISMGIISGMNRKVRAESTNFEMDCFQTDAAISPGNSGGALVNLCGQVIGITSSKYANSSFFSGPYEGLGFAITINEALPIIKELMEQGYVSGRVRIGIQFLENDAAHENAAANGNTLPAALDGIGVQVVSIAEDSDLRNTVLKESDWILSMNGKEVSDYDSINAAISGLGAGDSVHCRCASVQKDGKLKTYEIDFRLLEDTSGEY